MFSLLKQIVYKSHLYLPVLPFSSVLKYLAYLSEAIAWCVSEAKTLPLSGGGPDSITRFQMYENIKVNNKLDQPIDYLEFGVYRGASIAWWVNANQSPESRFYGFDTFTGLPEDWGALKEGHFTTAGMVPEIKDSRVIFIKGLFQDTLDRFLQNYRRRGRLVVHIDADLYSSTLFVLTKLGGILKRNDIILFDEFLAWKYPTHEFRAFCDFAAAYRLQFRMIGASDNFARVSVELL